MPPKPRKRKGMTAEIALSLVGKVIELQRQHPDKFKKIEELQSRVLEAMKEIRTELDAFSEREREVVTVSVINFIHDKADETLVP